MNKTEEQEREQGLERPPSHRETDRKQRARSWFREHPIATLTAVLVLGLVVAGGLSAWSYYSVRESTDDARVDAHVAPVSARCERPHPGDSCG